MKCFLLSRDLMFSSQAASAANNAGYETKTIANDEQLPDQLSEMGEYIVLLDLSIPSLDIAITVQRLKGRSPSPLKIIAVGPHVQAGKLEAARESGCDLVLTKGQASRELGDLLVRLHTG